MDTLPLELFDRICDFLAIDDLKNTLTVSRNFQHASERASGAFSQFDLTEDNANVFLDLYSGRRWGYLRLVRFRTHLPPYQADDDNKVELDVDGTEVSNQCRESFQELREKDEFFTKQILFLFTTLRTIEDQVSSGKLQLTIFTPVREVYACPHRKSSSWRLHLQDPEKLPELPSIHALCLNEGEIILPLQEAKCLQRVDLRMLIDMAVHLPSLEHLGCKLSAGSGWTGEIVGEAARQYLHDWAGPHRDSRHDFAKALESVTLPSTLRNAKLDFLFPLEFAERIDQREPVPNLASPAAHDPFSSSLRLLSHQLRKLELRVVADTTLFWPEDGAASFPYLESVCILFHMSSPSGGWYFKGPRGEGQDTKGSQITEASYPPLEDTPSDEEIDEYAEEGGFDISTCTCSLFRVVPNDEALVPFLTAFAKAASTMPAIKEACIWSPLAWDPYDVVDYDEIPEWNTTGWGIAYTGPNTLGFGCFPGQAVISESRQLWGMTGRWMPSDELRYLFQKIG
ncbi:hypothetical protein BCR34DRAFT_464224, partial [Clohesyomyces aquaticus]